MAVQDQKNPSYCEDVLAEIKKLDQLTYRLSIPSASRRNYVNELDLNEISVEISSEDNE